MLVTLNPPEKQGQGRPRLHIFSVRKRQFSGRQAVNSPVLHKDTHGTGEGGHLPARPCGLGRAMSFQRVGAF